MNMKILNVLLESNLEDERKANQESFIKQIPKIESIIWGKHIHIKFKLPTHIEWVYHSSSEIKPWVDFLENIDVFVNETYSMYRSAEEIGFVTDTIRSAALNDLDSAVSTFNCSGLVNRFNHEKWNDKFNVIFTKDVPFRVIPRETSTPINPRRD